LKIKRRKAKEWSYATAPSPRRQLNRIFSPRILPHEATLCTLPLMCCSKVPIRRFSRVPLSSHVTLSCLDRSPTPDPVMMGAARPSRHLNHPCVSDDHPWQSMTLVVQRPSPTERRARDHPSTAGTPPKQRLRRRRSPPRQPEGRPLRAATQRSATSSAPPETSFATS
jgi:hypothetical protein